MFTDKNSSFEALHQSSLISFTPSWCELLFLFDFWSARDYLFCLPLYPQQNAATAWIGHRSIAQRRTFMNSGVQEWYVIDLCFGVPQVGWGKQVYLLYMTKLEKSMMHSFYKAIAVAMEAIIDIIDAAINFIPPVYAWTSKVVALQIVL